MGIPRQRMGHKKQRKIQLSKNRRLKGEKSMNEEEKYVVDYDTLEGEIREIDFVISLAESDKAVEKYLLSEILRKFEVDGLKNKQEQVFYEDKIAEVVELTRHDTGRIHTFCMKLVETPELDKILFDHYIDLLGSQGMLKQ
jgi:hypothetical protein